MNNMTEPELLSEQFAPILLGVGISGGAEAAVHANRRYVMSMLRQA